MVGMVGQQRCGAIQLLGCDQAHQHVRQGERAERPGFIGAGKHVGCMAFRATDQQHKIAAEAPPVFEALRELLGSPVLAAAIKRNHVYRFRQR